MINNPGFSIEQARPIELTTEYARLFDLQKLHWGHVRVHMNFTNTDNQTEVLPDMDYLIIIDEMLFDVLTLK